MQNYRYRSSGGARGCVRQPEPRQDIPVCRERDDKNECTERPLERLPIAMAYVPWSRWRNIYEAEKGLQRGTIFQELDKPFCGIGGCQNVR